MILDSLKPLVESGVLSEATKVEINEAWEAKINEARDEIRVEIRGEFADRYAHDKKVMVEALDKMVSETLGKQVQALVNEKQAAVRDRVKTVESMKTLSSKFKKFMTEALAQEVKEFRADKISQKKATMKLENFVMKHLAKELTEFQIDRKDLAATKVKLVTEADGKFEQLKSKFVQRSAKLVKEAVTKQLKKELAQLHEDIAVAKQNTFGRKIFESYASEFAATYMNENVEMRKLTKQLAEAKKEAKANATLLEDTKKKLNNIGETSKRNKIMNELLSPLSKEKGTVMNQLLENVQTDNLRSAYDKYLSAVLDNKAVKRAKLNENMVESTGNRTAKKINKDENEDNIIDMKRLAGI